MNRLIKIACSVLFTLCAIVPAQATVDDARAQGLAYLVKNQKGDGSWYAREAIKVQSTAAALEALMNAGIRSGETFGAGTAWLGNSESPSTDSQARKLIALNDAGYSITTASSLLSGGRNSENNWGSYAGHQTSVIDTGLALAAMVRVNGAFNDFGICALLRAQSSTDGGWPHLLPATGAPIHIGKTALLPTVYMALGLKRYVDAGNWVSTTCTVSGVSTTYTFTNVLNAAISGLAATQHADGGFGENPASTPLETALVYSAIQAINPSHAALAAAQNYLVIGAGKPGADGSWGGDPLTTALALKTLPTVTLPDTDRDGLPDVVEAAMNNGSSTTVADGRDQAPGNGQSIVGVTAPLPLPAAILGQAYSYNLAQAGLSGFALSTGGLPPGLTLSPGGLLSGTPTQSGAFSFQYQASPSFTQLAQLSVTAPGATTTDGDVPTLPEWGMLIMGALLFGSILRHTKKSRHAA